MINSSFFLGSPRFAHPQLLASLVTLRPWAVKSSAPPRRRGPAGAVVDDHSEDLWHYGCRKYSMETYGYSGTIYGWGLQKYPKNMELRQSNYCSWCEQDLSSSVFSAPWMFSWEEAILFPYAPWNMYQTCSCHSGNVGQFPSQSMIFYFTVIHSNSVHISAYYIYIIIFIRTYNIYVHI